LDPRQPAVEANRIAVGCDRVVDAPLPREGGSVPWREHDLSAPAVLLHTSGTSGAPKPVELSYGNFLWNALGSAVALGGDPAERWLCTLPLAHVGGLSILFRSAIYGTTVILHERFDTEAALAAIRNGATIASLVPTTLARLLDGGLAREPALRCVLLGGAPTGNTLLERAAACEVPVARTYGLTEACSQVTTQAPGDRSDDSGPPLFCTRVEIDDGEIVVSGPTVAGGGTLRTGDLGEWREGRLRVVGRRSELIVSGGENIAPAEVENALLSHPAVAEAGVVGVAHPEWGEAVRAVVVVRAPVSEAELREHCGGLLARFKVPKEIVVREEPLPRTPSGKLLRRELR
jgi:O-succinylbenzoic acid--CoA ligase